MSGGYLALSLWMVQYDAGEYGLGIRIAALLAACCSLPGGVLRAVGRVISDKYAAHSVTWWVMWVCWICLFLLSYPPASPFTMNNTTTSGADIVDWRPGDIQFWESKDKKIAYRNLWISIPALLCGFAVWGMWGIVTVQMMNLGYPFSQAELFAVTAIAGLAGAAMRILASFLIRLSGGRNTIFLTTAMLLAPAIGIGVALQHPEWPLWSFQLMAL